MGLAKLTEEVEVVMGPGSSYCPPAPEVTLLRDI